MGNRLVALLRGINVGRAKRVGMADLRDLLGRLGYTDVATHLQSGNAIFTSSSAATAAVAERIEAAVAADLGVRCSVIVRTAAELDAVVAGNPMLDVVTDPTRHLVGFLSEAPPPAAVRSVTGRVAAPDVVRIRGREIYLWCPAGILNSAFARVKWDRELGTPVTMRNWATVTRLAAMAGG
ncbi:MAG: DUF1697 domain-containing protein [Candidatus Dormibacteria bacterium]